MSLGYVRIHKGLYLVYVEGKQRAEIDNDDGDWWTITLDGERKENLMFTDLREAKKALENMVLREIDDRETFDTGC